MIRPTFATIDHDALRGNLAAVRAAVGRRVRVLAPVKGDAYGHGAVPVARTLADAGCDAFGVALVEEGAQLRDAGIEGMVLCLGGVGRYGADEVVRRGLTPVLYDEGDAERLDAAARAAGRPVRVHLKVDTGMGRLGVPLPHWEHFLDRLSRFGAIEVEGLMTHFSESDALDETYTREQHRRFRAALASLRARGWRPSIVHACNSGAVLTRADAHADMVRPGIVLYGVAPASHLAARLDLRPVMRLETQVLFVKDLPPHARVSYGGSFTTRRPSRVATLPVGYADGYPRALGNRAEVLVGGRRCPVVGVVCMDLCMVDVTDVPTPVESGDPVVLVGTQGTERVSVEELAAWSGTIPYEVLCGFSVRIPRL
jgi:alanine racemase